MKYKPYNLKDVVKASEQEKFTVVSTFVGGRQFSDFKPMLVERATEVLSPISNKMNLIMKDIPELDKILDNGASKAKSIAEPILQKTFDIIGMR